MASEPAAERITFAPAAPASEDALVAAAMTLPEALDGTSVLVGDEVTAGDVRLVAVRATPPARARVARDATELVLTPRPLPDDLADRRLVFDLLVLVDASWSMGKARPDRAAPFTLVRPALHPFLGQAGDLVRHAALATFTTTPVARASMAPLAALDLAALADTRPRGRTALAPALDAGLALLAAEADPRNRHTVLLFTDDSESDARLAATAARASRLGVAVHVVDLGDEPSEGLRALARATRGVYAYMPDGVTLGPVFRAMAGEVDAPFEWQEPDVAPGGETQFDVVLRQAPEKEDSR